MNLYPRYVEVKLDDNSVTGALSVPDKHRELPVCAEVMSTGPNSVSQPGDKIMFMAESAERYNGKCFVPERFSFAIFRGEQRLENLVMPNGWIMIEIPFVTARVDGNVSISDMKATETQNMASCRRGVVVKLTDSAINPYDDVINSYYDKDPFVDVEGGDEVFFSPFVIHSIRDGNYFHQAYFHIDGRHFIIIPYKELTLRVSRGMKGLNGWAIASKSKASTMLTMSDKLRKSIENDTYTLKCDVDGFLNGDEIVIRDIKNPPPLEPEFIQTLPEQVFLFKENLIIGSFENKLKFL